MPRNIPLVFCAIVLLAVSSSSASTLHFQPPVTISTGTASPNNFAVGDFDGDGKPDMAIPDQNGKTVAIYLNAGAGTFHTPIVTTLAIDNTVGAILAGDVNEDGKLDLIVSTVAGDQFAIVLLGKGDGTFTEQPPISGSFGFLSGKVADLNGDGHLDLFLGGNGTIFTFLGNGDGTFSQRPVPAGSFPGLYIGVTAGDFSGDKHVDGIAVDLADPAAMLGFVDFFPGDGLGSFGTPSLTQPPTMPNPASIDAADFNHDGKLDLIVGSVNGAYAVSGNGDGSFQWGEDQAKPIYSVRSVPPGGIVIVGAADLNHDGTPDAVVLDGGNGVLALALNDGSGTFPDAIHTPYSFQVPKGSYHFATADFNGDGLLDVVVSNCNAKTMTIFLSAKNAVSPTVNFSGGNAASLVGTPLIFNVSVSGGTTVATGVVTLLDAGTQVSQETLDAAGAAVFSVSSIAVGAHSFSVSYSGDANFMAATSTSISQSATDFHVGVLPASQAVVAGSSAAYTLSLTPDAGFTGTVAVTCSGLPQLASCKAASVDLANAAGTVVITVATTAPTTAMIASRPSLIFACGLLGFFSLCCVPQSRGALLRKANVVLPLAVFVLVLGMSACGGGTNSTPIPKKTIPGTPAGTSNITISASATQNGVVVTHSVTALLTVQ